MKNKELQAHRFLQTMFDDQYYPDFLVEKGSQILVRLCAAIETEQPKDDAGVYKLTHAATEEFNALAEEFDEHDSEIETVARDAIGLEFERIAEAYGYALDGEQLIAPRDW